MAITFFPNKSEGYFVTKFSGEISDGELLNSYKKYYENDEWIPLLKELTDLSEANMTKVTSDGLKRLSDYIEDLFIGRGITNFQTAVYAPSDLPFGISRVYDVMVSESPESIMVFRQLSEAILWLKDRQ